MKLTTITTLLWCEPQVKTKSKQRNPTEWLRKSSVSRKSQTSVKNYFKKMVSTSLISNLKRSSGLEKESLTISFQMCSTKVSLHFDPFTSAELTDLNNSHWTLYSKDMNLTDLNKLSNLAGHPSQDQEWMISTSWRKTAKKKQRRQIMRRPVRKWSSNKSENYLTTAG